MTAAQTWRRDEAGTALRELRAGFDTLASLLAVTLGPTQGVVLSEVGRGSSESLLDSASIARRITALPTRRASAGAALAGEMVRRVAGQFGDGGATTVVLARAILGHAAKVVAAGANPVLVRHGIQAGIAAAADALKDQSVPVPADPASGALTAGLVGLATAATGDAALGAVVGEMADVLGVDGAVQIEEHAATSLTYDYLDGARWRGRPAERDTLPGASTELTLVEPAVIVADLDLTEVDQVRPLLEAALSLPGRPPVLVVARDITGGAASMFGVNDLRGTLVCAPVVMTTSRTQLSDDLDDLALLTGAEVVCTELGRPPERFRASSIGRARRAVVERGYLTVTGGHGAVDAVTERAARLRNRAWELEQAPQQAERNVGERLWLRQARLSGRVGFLRIGAATEQEVEARKDNARKAVRLVQTALRGGVVAGGGVAYLDCIPAVRARRARCADGDEALGVDAVGVGLEAPFLQIVRNAGRLEPRVALEKARDLGSGHGVDARSNRYAAMVAAGICDVAGVAAGALEAAGETAALLVSAEVVAGRG